VRQTEKSKALRKWHKGAFKKRLAKAYLFPLLSKAALTLKEKKQVGILRAIVCILLPPLAVLDKGCGSILIVLALTLLGWIPGIIAALIICTRKQ
jgi:uncharacterized membrane protein YqaE (UPF0057 family)